MLQQWIITSYGHGLQAEEELISTRLPGTLFLCEMGVTCSGPAELNTPRLE